MTGRCIVTDRSGGHLRQSGIRTEERSEVKSLLKDLFRGKSRYVTVPARRVRTPGTGDGALQESPRKKEIPDGLWTKCRECGAILYNKELKAAHYVCMKCGHHFRVGAWERLAQLTDPDSFVEWDTSLRSENPLDFPGYEEKVASSQKRTELEEAVLTGRATMDGIPVAIGILDFGFMSGSMGSVVGEKVARLFDRALEQSLPVIIVSGGGGGARMQEGILSLMQMAKTCQAVERFSSGTKPYISVLTDPTMGGVYASFAALGNVVIAEPKALIGFAGPRIVERTIRQPLPPNFQTSEFALENGMIDCLVPRPELRSTLVRLLRLHGCSAA